MKRIKGMVCVAAVTCCLFQGRMDSMASEGTTELTMESAATATGEYTTIRVNAEDDSGAPLQYAIDSDAPDAFGSSNEFTVEKGSEHTVYVKDAAGNISAQVYRVSDADVDMEVNIGYSDTSSAAWITDEERKAIENGGGTTAERVITDGSSEAKRLFYTVTTKDGHVFYLMIDQGRGEDNVYLLDQVTDEDLFALAADGEAQTQRAENRSVFDTTNASQEVETVGTNTGTAGMEKEKSGGGDWFFFLLLLLLAVAAIYYYKGYKPKREKMKNISDAKDLDEFEFEAEEEEEDEALDFAVSKEERDAEMDKILNGNDFEDDITEEEETLSYDPEKDFQLIQNMQSEEEESEYGEEETQETVEQLELSEEEE